MRVAYYSVEGSTLSWCKRFADEGCDVQLYQQSSPHRNVGRGIVPMLTNRDQWLSWGLADPETIFFFDCTSTPDFDIGEFADRLRARGRFVIGGGTFMDKLENNREFGATIAERACITTPDAHDFSTIREALSFLRSNPKQEDGDGGWAWKSDRILPTRTHVGDPEKIERFLSRVVIPRHGDRIKCVLEERIDGTPLSTARWWNGIRFTGPFEGTLEHQKYGVKDVGPGTGCAFNLLWFYRDALPKIARQLCWDKLEAEFRGRNAPPGLYDINAVVNRQGAWFLEWTPRLGIDSELTSQRGITSLSELCNRLVRGGDIDDLFDCDQAYMSVRLTVPPYPNEHGVDLLKSPALGLPVADADGLWDGYFVGIGVERGNEGLQVADPYGLVGVAVAEDTTIEGGYGRIYEYLDEELHVPDLMYRTDAVEMLTKDLEALAKAGYGTDEAVEAAA